VTEYHPTALLYLPLAIRAAGYSDNRRFKMGAVIFKRNRVVSFGCNLSKTHPKSNNAWKTIHAEMDALRGEEPIDLIRASILVIRVTKTGKLATSRPCLDCQNLLRGFDIQEMFYVNGDRSIVSERL